MIETWKVVSQKHMTSTKNYLLEITNICKEYRDSKSEIYDIGFNIFTIASDFYYRENFHSDIIKALLDPKGKHSEEDKYLNSFIDLLNKQNFEKKIHKENYKNAKVIREQSRIDILIIDDSSKKAIIIENKINNAHDMPRQLPRYYYEIKQQYTVDAIVYLTLDSSKTPDIYDWTDEELVEIKSILKIIPSYSKNHTVNLYSWLQQSMLKTNNIDSYYLIRQYCKLLKYLNTNYMDTISLGKFYETIKENDNLQSSISIRNMLNDLPEYLAIRIEDKYKDNCYPFKKVWRYQRVCSVFEGFEISNVYIKIDIACSESGYKLSFYNRLDEFYDIKYAFANSDVLDGFEYASESKNHIVKYFGFYEEDILFTFLDKLLIQLIEKKGNIK